MSGQRNNRDRRYFVGDPITASQQDRMAARAAEEGSRALLKAIRAYARKYHGVGA